MTLAIRNGFRVTKLKGICSFIFVLSAKAETVEWETPDRSRRAVENCKLVH